VIVPEPSPVAFGDTLSRKRARGDPFSLREKVARAAG